MSEDTKPNLPDPGAGRYWSIEADSAGYLTLALMTASDDYLEDDIVLFVSNMMIPTNVTAETFETLAAGILEKETKTNVFVGVYRFEENE